ncbi:hypothetical protein F8M41_021956 [Gigaspora margarita]|uniref:Uncharacterized protein n=1 Tax=Gigaspora margarita TaxID=4874 RepID=A0A8H4AFX1_GIGMA|nr:hypothetical protein F8M41_021956 [Gigaspora margarita]
MEEPTKRKLTENTFDVNKVDRIYEARYYCKDTLKVKKNKYKGVKVEIELSRFAKMDHTNKLKDPEGCQTRKEEKQRMLARDAKENKKKKNTGVEKLLEGEALHLTCKNR